MAAKKTKTYVLVTTAHRGVFFGELAKKSPDGKTVVLREARFAIRWGTTDGVFQLAHTGPTTASKIGAPAPEVELQGVTCVAKVRPAAVEAWLRA